MPNNLTIACDPHDDGVAVARFTDRLDFTYAPKAQDQFITPIADGYPTLIVYAREAGFVDSAGLGFRSGSMRAARQAGGDLRIANPSEQARMLLSLTSLDQVLTVSPTLEEALHGVS